MSANDLSLPLWAAIPPREAVRLAIESAEALDERLEGFPPALLEKIYGQNSAGSCVPCTATIISMRSRLPCPWRRRMQVRIETLSKATEAILCPPFDWRPIPAGAATLEDARQQDGTAGGDYRVAGFAIARCQVTNAQYQRFLSDPNGYVEHRWWDYSPQALQWRKDHRHPRQTAFDGAALPRTRVSWFDAMAFCNWLTVRLRDISAEGAVRLPTEQEWQRAAVGDTGWDYPWGIN